MKPELIEQIGQTDLLDASSILPTGQQDNEHTELSTVSSLWRHKKGTIITNIQLFLSLGVSFFWLLCPHIKLCIVSQCVIMEEEHGFIELVGDLSTG